MLTQKHKKHKCTAAILLSLGIFFSACKNENSQEATTQATPADSASSIPAPAQIQYTLVNTFPHDPTAFTEGLQYVDGNLYESTGRYAKSDIRRTDLKTGKMLQQQKLDAKYFGEGLTVMNGKIYQLTYQEHTGFIYDQKTMKQLKTFPLTTNEGWGMTHDGTNLIYGDGTSKLYFLNPETQEQIKTITVADQYGTVSNVNELEYINGYIYANQWQTDLILKINPENGNVVGIANLAALRQQTGIPPLSAATTEDSPEVLNGIAYDKEGNRIFVTGKNWPNVFEIKLDN